MKKIGYIENGLTEKELTLHVTTLLAYGCEEVILENEFGIKLAQLYQQLDAGVELVVYNLASLNKTAKKLIAYITRLQKKGIQFHSLAEGLSTKKEISLDLMETLELLADIHESISPVEKKQQRKIGRPKIETEVIEKILYYREKEAMSYRDISELTDVSLGTVHKYVKGWSR